MQNPFTVGRPIDSWDRFIGRRSELARAFDQIANCSNLAVWGGSGVGKSSFLMQLTLPKVWEYHSQDFSKAVIVSLSCANIFPFSIFAFWREVFMILREQLEGEPALQSEVDAFREQNKTTKDNLRRILGKLGREGKFLLLLVDDYNTALIQHGEQYTNIEINTFLSECRSLAYHSNERRYLSMIVASNRPLNELGPALQSGSSPWYNHYLYLPLKPFTDQEIRSLLEREMTPPLQEGVREIAGNNPALLQIAGSLLHQNKLHPTGENQTIAAFATEFERSTRQHFQTIWQLSDEIEQALLMLIALSNLQGRLHNKFYDLTGIDLILHQKERELTKLEEQGIIMQTLKEGKKAYVFTSSLMERWVIQELGNSDDLALKNREKIFLNLMNQQQLGRVKTAIHWLWTNKNEVPSVLELIGKIVKALPGGLLFG